jgi:2-polyprenyl-3-methyl-5-hydroxy-6-metoxy-1,4-benzoquinol methylase
MTTITIDEESWFDINYVEQIAYHTHFIPLLNNKRVVSYCEKRVFRSLSQVGFSQSFCESLISDLAHLNFNSFHQKFDVEIKEAFNKTFQQAAGAKYFTENVIPNIPSSRVIIDIGCGPGVLIKELAKCNKFGKIMGCDWNSCPEWKDIVKENENRIEFHVVKDDMFSSFIKTYNPDTLILTYVMHHMELPTQHKYMKNLFDIMHPGATLIIVEDSYSTILPPDFKQDDLLEFMALSEEEKRDVLTIHDWVFNIFLERRAMPIPSTYRTVEGWESFFSEIGFNIVSKRFIGWSGIDLFSPEGLLVLKKPDNDV